MTDLFLHILTTSSLKKKHTHTQILKYKKFLNEIFIHGVLTLLKTPTSGLYPPLGLTPQMQLNP